MRAAAGLLVLLTGLMFPTQLWSHEVRPAYLEFTAHSESSYAVTWKQPVVGNMRLAITPVLPESCRRTQNSLPEHTGAALIERWQVDCDLRSGTVGISGLNRTLTDTLLVIRYQDGTTHSELLRPDRPTTELGTEMPSLSGYLALGIEHLLFGIDHILFVIALVLFIKNRWMLLKTITAFTLAHSMTLALSVLNLVQLPAQPVEAVIALSIVFMARELLVAPERQSAITRIRPWLMAFAFGLLHGFGFAGALRDIGLPDEHLAAALLLFNVGIEIGQLLVIALWFCAAWLLRRAYHNPGSTWQQLPAAAMGSLAAFWTIDRLWLLM